MIEKAEKQQTLADFLLLAQNVEKELASAVQSIDMVQAKLYIPSTTYKHLNKRCSPKPFGSLGKRKMG